MIYKCGHCNFIGHSYGIPTSAKCGVSAPFCSRCGKNDKLKKVNPPNKSLNLTSPVDLA